MQLIFLNTLEQKVEDNRVRTAQVSIHESQGIWRVIWIEPRQEEKEIKQIWYEGPEWQGMLQAYKEGLLDKRGAGFYPLIDTVQEGMGPERNKEVLLLQFYAERHYSEELFQKLRQWRREQAAKEGKSAYFIATNRMLYMIAAYLPHTLDELKSIPGFGKRKCESYGPAILEYTAEFPRETAFPLHWVTACVEESEFTGWLTQLREARAKQEWEQQALRRKLLEGIGEGFDLKGLEAGLQLKRREVIRLLEELEREGYDVSTPVEQEISGLPTEETEQIQELFRQTGDRFLKPILMGLFNEEELAGQDLNRLYENLRLQRMLYRSRMADRKTPGTTAAV